MSEFMNPARVQASMEYLMTYGAAVAFIAIALAAIIFFTGFGSGGNTPQGCFYSHPYDCQSPGFTHSSNTLSISLAENSGSPYFDVALACATSTNPLSAQKLRYTNIMTLGAPSNVINSGQTISLSGLPCYTSAASTLRGTIGTPFTATVWIAYDYGTNPSYGAPITLSYSKLATVNLKIS